MTTYKLHYFPESGNSYKLALMLTLSGYAFEPIWTDFGGCPSSLSHPATNGSSAVASPTANISN